MTTQALYVRLEAKKGKEQEVEQFLRNGLSIVQGEPETTTWFAVRMGDSTYGIFDTFSNESGRQAHLNGRLAAALKERSSDLFSQPPSVERIEVLAAKVPGQAARAGA